MDKTLFEWRKDADLHVVKTATTNWYEDLFLSLECKNSPKLVRRRINFSFQIYFQITVAQNEHQRTTWFNPPLENHIDKHGLSIWVPSNFSVVSQCCSLQLSGQIWCQGGLTILCPGPSEQSGPLGTGTSWALRSFPAQTTVTLWFSDSSGPNTCFVSLLCQRHMLGLLLLHQRAGGTSGWSSVQQLTMTTGQSSPPQLTSPFAVLPEVLLVTCFFCVFE